MAVRGNGEWVQVTPFTIEHAVIHQYGRERKLNLGGRPERFNQAGRRYLEIMIPTDLAHTLQELGWNIKWTTNWESNPNYDTFVPEAYLKVNVSFPTPDQELQGNRRCDIFSAENGALVHKYTEMDCHLLDGAKFKNIDITVRPGWSRDQFTGEWRGPSAYLEKLVVEIDPGAVYDDPLNSKYDFNGYMNGGLEPDEQMPFND